MRGKPKHTHTHAHTQANPRNICPESRKQEQEFSPTQFTTPRSLLRSQSENKSALPPFFPSSLDPEVRRIPGAEVADGEWLEAEGEQVVLRSEKVVAVLRCCKALLKSGH